MINKNYNHLGKHYIFSVLLAILITIIQLTKCSRTEDNPLNSKRADIDIISENGTELDTITGYIKRDINILVSVLFPDELDSISYKTGNDLYGRFSKEELSKDLNLTLSFNIPCTTKVVVSGIKNGIPVTSDSTVLCITEENNQPPTLKLKPFRLYAAPCLPCTIKVSVSNPEIWQQVNLSCEITMDSLFIWTPGTEIIGNTVMVNLTAIDNGLNPDSAKDSVLITVIADSSLPPTPVNFKVDMRTDSFVAISWNKDPLADSYILYRSVYGNDSISEEIRVSDTSYIDSTSIAYFYRISAANFFGISNPSDIIYGIDTVNYGQRVFFTDSGTTAFESDSFHTIRIQVAKQATDNINVWFTLKSSSADTSDFRNVSYSSLIPFGDTVGICTLSIVNDNLKEEIEDFVVSLDSVSHGFIYGRNIITVSIVDDDTLFTIIYNRNGATAGEIPVDQNSYKQNAYATVLGNSGQLTKTGYFFDGWRDSPDTSGKEYKPGDKFLIGATCIRLYAQWIANKYTVSYDGNGNTSGNPPQDEEHIYQEKVTVADIPAEFKKDGFNLIGWETIKNGIEDTLTQGDTFTMDTSDITLTAIWSNNQYVIKYNGNGNDSGTAPDFQICIYDSFVIVKYTDDLRKTGNSFSSWNTEKDGSGQTLNPGDKFKIGGSDITFYAQWTKNKYTIRYYKNGDDVDGTEPTSETVDYGTRITVKSQGELSYEHHKFTGWNTLPGGGGETFTPNQQFDLGASDLDLYAQWVISKPEFRLHPKDTTLRAGHSHLFTVFAEGIVDSYQWMKNGEPIDGATSYEYIIDTVTNEDQGTYTCIATNSSGPVESNSALLNVIYCASVSSGSIHTMIVMSDGTLWGTGNNGNGQLGNGTINTTTPVYIMSNVDSVYTGNNYTMILMKDGELRATGSNAYYQLGFEDDDDRTTPVKLTDNVHSVSTKSQHTMVLKNDGTLWGAGFTWDGQIGISVYYGSPLVQVNSGVTAVSAGISHSMVLKDGMLYATGQNNYGGFGNGSAVNSTTFTSVIDNVNSISAGRDYTMAIMFGDKLYATGANFSGELGDNTYDSSTNFKEITSEVSFISAGGAHSLIIKKDGTLYSTGSNSQGQLGIGSSSTLQVNSFNKIMTDVKFVSAGDAHTMIIKKNGTLWATGYNSDGQLGTGNTNPVYSPVMVKF